METPFDNDRDRIYCLLNNEREIVVDPHTGDVMRREAWKVIDVLLDSLIEFNAITEVLYEPTT